MAESSSRNGVSLSPITNLAQDHLYSILLLLPTDSILAFASTCERFKSVISNSPSLWESICRRDWGNPPVDAFKSSSISDDDDNQLSWKKLYQQVYQIDRVSCRKLSDPVNDDELQYPRSRASHSLNFLSAFLVLFGGGSDGGRHLDDTWIAYIGNDFRRILKWQMVNSGIPSGRFGHSSVVIGDHVVLFGGINDHGIRQNDTWIGQINNGGGGGIKLCWRLLDVGPIAPPARGAHAGCSTDERKMVIHGGIGLSGTRLGDTWILDLSSSSSSSSSDIICYGRWREIVSGSNSSCPAARSGHTLTYVRATQTVVLFGGRGLGYEVLHDVWLFKDSKWVQLHFELRHIGLSLARVGHSATLILGDKILIHGGEDTYRHRKNDFWVLDITSSSSSSSLSSLSSSSSSSSLSSSSSMVVRKTREKRMWRRLKLEGYKPKCRSFHGSCTDGSGRYLYVFGGMVDDMIEPPPGGLTFDGDLFLVELLL